MPANDRPDNLLFRWYERYIGEPETETDVYLGFGLFFVAVGFGVLSLFLFVVGTYQAGGIRAGSVYYTLAEPAFLLGMISLPVLMLSMVVLLPVKRRATYAAGVGVLVVGVAGVLFLNAYPSNWAEFGDSSQTLEVVGVYAFGLVIVLASTGTALVAHQLERVRAPSPSEVASSTEAEDEEAESISEAEIERDIEEAMADVDITWGGVEATENRQLSINTDFADDAIDAGNIDVEASKRVETGGVDEQVQGLRNMKGGETKTATSEATVDDQTAALNELKKQKEADQVPDNAPTAGSGLLGRVLARVGLS